PIQEPIQEPTDAAPTVSGAGDGDDPSATTGHRKRKRQEEERLRTDDDFKDAEQHVRRYLLEAVRDVLIQAKIKPTLDWLAASRTGPPKKRGSKPPQPRLPMTDFFTLLHAMRLQVTGWPNGKALDLLRDDIAMQQSDETETVTITEGSLKSGRNWNRDPVYELDAAMRANTVKVQVKVLSITLPGVASNDNHGEDDSLFGGGSDSGIARNQTLPITNGNGEGAGVARGVNDGDFSQDTDDDDRPLQGRRATTTNRTNRPLELSPDPNLVRWFVERMPLATALLETDVGPRAGFLLPSMGLVHSSGPPNFTCELHTPVAPAAVVISYRSP
ncbi:unnamed protein product, partial [Tilletia controversa]